MNNQINTNKWYSMILEIFWKKETQFGAKMREICMFEHLIQD